ncbi:MAG: nucleotide sugar dehydrogenase [Candidatus Thermoplasmatota archaeon]|jgi:UDP-N-acetyl-D-mannosaminuronic acid dehydrogenase|nr:nucleotide sugar dehydrogenase [Candidatus Thermoplasmatota archaeon]
MTIAVVGLGKAGLPLAAVIAEAGFDIVGIDVDNTRCQQINTGKNPIPEEPLLDELIKKYGGKKLIATSLYQDAKYCDFFIVIVPLFLNENHKPDFKLLENAFRNIGKILKKGDCVVLETTVPPLTTELRIRKWLEEESQLSLGDFYLAHSPERIMTGYSISRLREFPKIIGGVNSESGTKAYAVYSKIIPNLTLVSSARVAEFVKVIEGCYRFTNISLSNELFKIAEEFNIDFMEARTHANHKYCDIHLPSVGSGGHCIPVYPWFLINEMEERGKRKDVTLLRSSYDINEDMPEFWAHKIIQESKKTQKPFKSITICVTGITFRKGVKSLMNSKNLDLVKLLMKKGLKVTVSDELYSPEEIEQLGLTFGKPEESDMVFNPFTLDIQIQDIMEKK